MTTEEETAEGPTGRIAGRISGRISGPIVRRTAGWAAAVAVLLFCALSGWWYEQARSDDSLAYAKARDTVLAGAQRDIASLSSIDAAKVDEGLRQWLDATTGPLHDRLRRTGASDSDALTKAGTSARATVTEAAITELDTRAGTARLIATVQVLVTPRTGAPTTDRKRLDAAMARTPDGWKLTALAAVPIGAS
jgi:Mce-associated membrane protein